MEQPTDEPYEVELSLRVTKEFFGLPKNIQEFLQPTIDGLAKDARPPGAVKLTGYKNAYRVRRGDYRIVYRVFDDQRIVSIARIAHLKSAYEGI